MIDTPSRCGEAQRYIDTRNETDPSARHAAVGQLYTEDARYVDPMAVAHRRRGQRCLGPHPDRAGVPRLASAATLLLLIHNAPTDTEHKS